MFIIKISYVSLQLYFTERVALNVINVYMYFAPENIRIYVPVWVCSQTTGPWTHRCHWSKWLRNQTTPPPLLYPFSVVLLLICLNRVRTHSLKTLKCQVIAKYYSYNSGQYFFNMLSRHYLNIQIVWMYRSLIFFSSMDLEL